MCGIAGYVGKGDQETLLRMAERIKHRGPDDCGTLRKGDAGLAFARLAVIDTSPAGHQPMENAAGTVAIVFNGEIYNYTELRETLLKQGARFRGSSDTEVILALYEREGSACFARLEGMFAIALYDVAERTLYLARDRMGEKPLYYAIADGTLIFGSELKALLAHKDAPRELDPESLAHYLEREYVPTPRTIYKDAHKLPPASYLKYAAGRADIAAFWNPDVGEPVTDERAALGRLDELLARSVKRQLVADVPLGIFLSGGIDSSTVAWYARQAAGPALETFSIGFEDTGYDESPDARLVAKELGTRHHEEILGPDEALKLIPELADVFDEPVADASVLPTMLLSRFTRTRVTVALGGDGADELLLGYPTFRAERYASYWHALPAYARGGIETLASRLPVSHGYLSAGFAARKFIDGAHSDPFVRHLQWLGAFKESETAALLTSSYASAASGRTRALIDAVRSECPRLEGENALAHLYMRTYLMDQVLVKVDRASMRYALETRAPFLDASLVSFLLSCSPELKYKDGKGKHLLRTLMRGRLPDRILDKKKHGFAVPIASWLAGPLKPLMHDLLSAERLTKQGIFDPRAVERLMREHLAGTHDNRKKLWTLLAFQLWSDRWMR